MDALLSILSAIWIEVMIDAFAIACIAVALGGGAYLVLGRLANRMNSPRHGGAAPP